jgi:small basic protein
VILLPLLAIILGIFLGRVLQAPLPGEAAGYAGLVVLAGLDALLGGLRGAAENRYSSSVLLTGLVVNGALACFLAWLGERIGLNLYLVSAFVLGWRIFTNASLLRRHALGAWREGRSRKGRRPDGGA